MLYLPRDHTLSVVFYRTTRVYGALLICWCCVGGLITSTQSSITAFAFSAGCFDRMDSQSDAEKQTNPVVSPLLLR